MGSNEAIKKQLQDYKRKFYKDKAVRGGIYLLAILLASFLLINTIEFSGRLNNLGRGFLLYSFLLSLIGLSYYLVFRHLVKIRDLNKHLSNEQAAVEIGKFFPNISDKLLNIIQLENLNNQQNELLIASIAQKSAEIANVPFSSAIDIKANRKFLKYAYIPAAIILVLLIAIPGFITESSTRIVKYNEDFIPEAPFQFIIEDEDLKGFTNEQHTIDIQVEGSALPNTVSIVLNNRKVQTTSNKQGRYSYTFDRLAENQKFYLKAEGLSSRAYTIETLRRPSIFLFNISIENPTYTGIEPSQIENTGNLTVAEGAKVTWNITAESTSDVEIRFKEANSKLIGEEQPGSKWQIQSEIEESDAYSINLFNENSSNKDSLIFSINVIEDQFPKINLEQLQDTVLFKNIVFAGNITDDYGFSSLQIRYSYDGGKAYQRSNIDINKDLSDQSYYEVLELDKEAIQAGAEIKYYVQVTDNDGFNGPKTSKTGTYTFKIPSLEELQGEIEASTNQVKSSIDKTLKEAEELNRKIKDADERLKTKKELEWQDEKLMQEILDQKEKLAQRLEELQKENARNNEKQQQFNPQNQEIQQKMQQLREIMENVMDEETRRLYEELQKLLDQNSEIEEFREKMDELSNNSENLEEDLERTLELFKTLQFDAKLQQNIDQLGKEIKDQGALNEETENADSSNEELVEKQQEEIDDLEKLQEELDKLNELNQERKNPDKLPEDTKEELEEAKEDQERAKDELEKEEKSEESQQGEKSEESEEKKEEEENEGEKSESKPNSKASQAQQRASQKMQQAKESLESMQAGMEEEQQQENLEDLIKLVDNLVSLSYSQEDLMNDFKALGNADPRYVELSQRQSKLKDDSQIIKDSLNSLAERVFQISSFIIKEVNEMERQMDGTIKVLKEKRVSEAVGKQQFTMTSINNLALLLDDVVQQMQNQMANGSGSTNGNKKNRPQMGGVSELQKQLSEQISELKQSGKSGRQLSEELAKLAAKQEQLRNTLENFETGTSGQELGQKIDELVQQMEENEWDLINKNITQETINRQQDILTRLLDAKNALQQRGEDDERKGNTAYNYDISVPESISDYLKAKEKEIELLKTIPAKLNPYYKRETNKYFKRIKQQK